MHSRALALALVTLCSTAAAQSPTPPQEPSPSPASPVPQQEPEAPTPPPAQPEPSGRETAPPPAEEAEDRWRFSATVLSFFVPGDREYVQPIVQADRDWLHLEARFNYEAENTGSFWIGANLEAGSEEGFLLEFTPMIGVAAGDAEGVAPGYRGAMEWKGFAFETEGEWLFDTENSEDSFFYSWSELSFAPIERLRFGIAVERTVLFQSDREIQRGLLLGYVGKRFDATGVWFNPDDSDPVFVLSVGAGF